MSATRETAAVPKPLKSILIIKLRALGDVLRTTCILSGLRTQYPNAYIHWVTSPEAVELLKNNALIDLTISTDVILATGLQRDSYDFVISLDDDIFACNLAASVNCDHLFGAYSINGERRYTDDSSAWFDMSLISRCSKSSADLLKKRNRRSYPDLLFDMLDIPRGNPLLEIPEQQHKFSRNFSEIHSLQQRKVIGLNTGAGDRWRFKKLSPEKTAQLVDSLIQQLGVQIILFGGPKETDRNKSIIQLAENNCIDAGCSNSLLEFSALINLCDVLVTTDSLALHIASSLSVKIIAFFGPTSSSEIDLFGQGEKIVPKMECICCYKRDCSFQITCMDNIRIEEIVLRAEKLLGLS